MENTKKKISLFTVAIALTAFLILVLVTNLLLNNYIEARAVASIKNVRESYSEDINDDLISYDENDLFLMVGTLDLPEQEWENNNFRYYLTKDQKDIIKAVKEGDYASNKIHELAVGSSVYYFTEFINPFSDEENINSDIILYTDVTPFKRLVATMNIIYGVILIALTIGSYFFGVRMGKEIEDSQEKLKHFFQNASHELKTPIMSIQGYAEGLKLGIIKDSDSALDIIMDESDKMAKLVEELLYISKLESGQIQFKKENVSIYDFIVDILGSYNPELKKRNIDIKLDIAEGLYAEIDEREFSKAIGNIISNGIRFAKSKISITAKRIDNRTVINIYNDGEKFEEKDIEHIFERFYIGKNGNTGIGLSMAMDIIREHKGTIVAKNEDVGVSFTITL